MAQKIFTSAEWEHAVTDVNDIIALLGLTGDEQVLDLCCGPGRHALEFARRGFAVTGVDRTGRYLDEARERAASEKLEIEFVQDDMRFFMRPETYDLIINLYTSFGYFENRDDDQQVLENIHRMLKGNGKVVIELMGKEVLARIFRERDWFEKDGVIYLEERVLKRDWSWIENRWIKIEGNTRTEFTLSHRLYSGIELSDLLLRVGFKAVTLYGSLSGVPYDHRALRLVAVGTR